MKNFSSSLAINFDLDSKEDDLLGRSLLFLPQSISEFTSPQSNYDISGSFFSQDPEVEPNSSVSETSMQIIPFYYSPSHL